MAFWMRSVALALGLSALFTPANGEPPPVTATLTLGQAFTRPGGRTSLPVLVRVAAGIPAQTLSLRVSFDPPSAVTSAVFRRAGATKDLNAAFEARPQTAESFSYLLALDSQPPGVSSATGAQLATLEVTVAPGVAAGTQILARIDPVISGVGSRDGTRFLSARDGGLSVHDGIITVTNRGSESRPE